MRWRGDKQIAGVDPSMRLRVVRTTSGFVDPDTIDPNEAAKLLLLPEEVAFFETHFPGVDLERLAGKRTS